MHCHCRVGALGRNPGVEAVRPSEPVGRHKPRNGEAHDRDDEHECNDGKEPANSNDGSDVSSRCICVDGTRTVGRRQCKRTYLDIFADVLDDFLH
jgi:hypothetical protein